MGEKSCENGQTNEKLRRGLLWDAADWETVVPVVVVGRINVTRIEVQVVGVVIIVDRTRPIVAVVTQIVDRGTIDVAGPHKP